MTDIPNQDVASTATDPWWRLRAEWIYAAITAGELRDHDAPDDVRYAVHLENLGRLEVPGGRFVAADPYVMDAEPQPFQQNLGAETAEVIAARALVGADNHQRIAALVLQAGPGPIREWQMATVTGQDPSSLDHDGFFGYGVDAGTGSFGSPEAMQVAHRVLSADAGMLEDPVSIALFSDGIGTQSAVLVAPEAGAVPIAACSSGWGDGVYPTWLGVDSSGNAVVAVTDFLLTSDPFAAPLPQERTEIETPKRAKSFLRRLLNR